MIFFIVFYFFLITYFLLFLIPAIRWYFEEESQCTFRENNLFFTVIIPARNEESNIAECIDSILKANNDGVNFEIIVVDDHSEDSTFRVVSRLIGCSAISQLKIIRLDSGVKGKKNAIRKGIELALGEVIITRDADTRSGENWLRSIAEKFSSSKPDFLICPVRASGDKSCFNLFQEMENFFLQIFTGGMALLKRPVLCNGANLAFKKASFMRMEGYEGNYHIASGDDIFLMEKFRSQRNYRIDYIKSINAEVTTRSSVSLRDFFYQKIRWAGKFSFRMNFFSTLAALVVFSFNFLLLLGFVMMLFTYQKAEILFLSFIVKSLVDFLLISFFSRGKINWYFFPPFILFELINLFYTPAVAMSSLFIKPVWKGRTISV
jgi:poly-beta-1,6-N-acetyl-D-glucosamine synthase